MTDSGLIILVRPVQPEKAKLPILVTEPGMTVFLQPAINELLDVSIMALQLSRESYAMFPLSTSRLSKLSQPSNAPSLMLVT